MQLSTTMEKRTKEEKEWNNTRKWLLVIFSVVHRETILLFSEDTLLNI